MTPDDTEQWYELLVKPWFAPPSWVFGPAWTFLYVLIAISFGYVFLKVIRREWPVHIAIPFIINGIANALFTPLQFGLKSNVLASLDILAVLGTVIWMIVIVWPRARWVAWMQLPYMLWVAFASVVQLSITWLNR